MYIFSRVHDVFLKQILRQHELGVGPAVVLHRVPALRGVVPDVRAHHEPV